MATKRFAFYVGRKGEEAKKCVAHLPPIEELLDFPGGEVVVELPNGKTTKIELPTAGEMILAQATILLQHGSRDDVFPPEEGESKPSKRRKTGFED